MIDELRLLFFIAGCACFAVVALTEGRESRADQRLIACGWLLFAVPFVWDTAFSVF